MADIDALELDTLWDEFHRLVNMTSQELGAWLRTSSADERSEALPEDSGTARGRHVLAILQKRRTDLTDDDIRLMYEVIETINNRRAEAPPQGPADDTWRHELMMLGHDPLRP